MATKGEPKTDAEARARQAELEKGAETILETSRSFTSAKPAGVVLGRTTTVPLSVEVPQLIEQVAGAETRALLELEFPSDGQDLSVLVFLNNDKATAETPASDPSFVGAVSFFCHGEERDGRFVCIHPDATTFKYRFDVTGALKSTRTAKGQARANLVAIGPPDGEPARREIVVGSARVEVARSVVKSG